MNKLQQNMTKFNTKVKKNEKLSLMKYEFEIAIDVMLILNKK